MFRSRNAVVAKRGSSIQSGLPEARQKFCQCLSDMTEIEM